MLYLAWCSHDLEKRMRGCEDLVLNPESYGYADRVSVERLEFEVEAVSKRIGVVLGEGFERVREAIVLAACIHDIGKALNHYQAILLHHLFSL